LIDWPVVLPYLIALRWLAGVSTRLATAVT
jgi:hypothetical protein